MTESDSCRECPGASPLQTATNEIQHMNILKEKKFIWALQKRPGRYLTVFTNLSWVKENDLEN